MTDKNELVPHFGILREAERDVLGGTEARAHEGDVELGLVFGVRGVGHHGLAAAFARALVGESEAA